jgi:hypothetical protein
MHLVVPAQSKPPMLVKPQIPKPLLSPQAAQRRITEARELHQGVALTARANAPQPTLTGQPATTGVTGPLYGYPSAPTSHTITGLSVRRSSNSTGTQQGFLLAIIPVKVLAPFLHIDTRLMTNYSVCQSIE